MHFSSIDIHCVGCAGDRANWGAEVHWSHVLDMTVSWGSGAGNGTDYKNSSTLLTSIKSAMDYWFANDYTNEGCTFGNGGSACPCGTPGLCEWILCFTKCPRLLRTQSFIYWHQGASIGGSTLSVCLKLLARHVLWCLIN